MSDHTKVLVPLESWCYHSPEIRLGGREIDIGLLAEALIYYEHAYVNVGNQPQFASLISWFLGQENGLANLFALFKDGTLTVYDYSFFTAPIQSQDGSYTLLNIQDEIEAQQGTFERRYLYSKSIDSCLPHGRQREQLIKSLQGRVIEAKAEGFGPAVRNAKADILDPRRSALIIQVLIDDLYRLLSWENPPEVVARINEIEGKHQVNWNIDINRISAALGKDMNLHTGTALAGAAVCNRLLWSAATLNCDLYIGSPMGMLVGNKMYESSLRLNKVGKIIEQLHARVEFPAIRELVNDGKMSFEDVLLFRKKAGRFRRWLQIEGERDRDAILAYHHDVAKDAGWSKAGRKSLNLLGMIAPSLASGFIGSMVAGTPGLVAAPVVGAGLQYIFDLGSMIGKDWRPIVFGDWARERIQKLLKEE